MAIFISPALTMGREYLSFSNLGVPEDEEITIIKARIHGATLRAILRATSVTRRGYTVATFRATLRAIFDCKL